MMNNKKVTAGQAVIFEGKRFRVQAVGLLNVTLFDPKVYGSERKVAKRDFYGRFLPVEEGIAPMKRVCDIVPAKEYSAAGAEYLWADPAPAAQPLKHQPGVVHLGTLTAVRDPARETETQRTNYIGSLRSIHN